MTELTAASNSIFKAVTIEATFTTWSSSIIGVESVDADGTILPKEDVCEIIHELILMPMEDVSILFIDFWAAVEQFVQLQMARVQLFMFSTIWIVHVGKQLQCEKLPK